MATEFRTKMRTMMEMASHMTVLYLNLYFLFLEQADAISIDENLSFELDFSVLKCFQ